MSFCSLLWGFNNEVKHDQTCSGGTDIIDGALHLRCAEDEAKVEERRREAEREADQREKEEFEERLRARDDEKTRRIVEQRIPKEELEVCSPHVVLPTPDL